MKEQQTISFHNTPSFYLEYTKNWLVMRWQHPNKVQFRRKMTRFLYRIFRKHRMKNNILSFVFAPSGASFMYDNKGGARHAGMTSGVVVIILNCPVLFALLTIHPFFSAIAVKDGEWRKIDSCKNCKGARAVG